MEISELISAFFDTAGPGGLIVITVLSTALFIYFRLTRWILAGGKQRQP